ncbi:MAG: hypothetical protein Q9224_000200 [Gallowayella concinna]
MDSFSNSSDPPLPEQSAPNLGINMLPTPAKTPRKQDSRKTAELQSAARVLFPTRLEKVEDAMPTKKGRRGRKNVGFFLDGSGEDESTTRIQIFTDSKDQVPELDMGEDNPFMEKPDMTTSHEPTKDTGRRGRRGQVKSNPQIEETFNHEEGMVYVFRGKKIFRRFTPDRDQPNLSSEETEIEGSASPRLRPFTRSAVKPRLLFPTEKQRRERELAEEEALTDIEDGHVGNNKGEKLTTPIKQSFTITTPPATGHATRSATKQAALNGGSSPLGPPEVGLEGIASAFERRPRKKTSPFNAWQRTKAGSDEHVKGRKRRVDQVEEQIVEAGNKKAKSNAVHR